MGRAFKRGGGEQRAEVGRTCVHLRRPRAGAWRGGRDECSKLELVPEDLTDSIAGEFGTRM